MELSDLPTRGRVAELTCAVASDHDSDAVAAEIVVPDGVRLFNGESTRSGPLAAGERHLFSARYLFDHSGVNELKCLIRRDTERGAVVVEGDYLFVTIGSDHSRYGIPPVTRERQVPVVWPDRPDLVRLPSEEAYPPPTLATPAPEAPLVLLDGSGANPIPRDAPAVRRSSTELNRIPNQQVRIMGSIW